MPDLVPEYHALPADHPSVDDADYINKISSLRRSFEQNMASVLIKIRAVPSTEPASSPGNTVATSTTADTTIRPVTVASPGNPSSSNSRDKGSSGGGGDLVTPENVNGGVEITPSERSVFRTLHRSRVVRDGGGIEPDILLAPTQVGPAEGVFFTQGTYPDFAKVLNIWANYIIQLYVFIVVF